MTTTSSDTDDTGHINNCVPGGLQLCSVAANFNLLPRSPVDNIEIILNTAATSNIPTADTADLVLVLRTQKTE